MTLKHLRDYIDSLDLDEVQTDVELVVYVHDESNAAKGYFIRENMLDFGLFFTCDGIGKPYLSISGESLRDVPDLYIGDEG